MAVNQWRRQAKDFDHDTVYARKTASLGIKRHEQTKPQHLEYRKSLWEEKNRIFVCFCFFTETCAVIVKLPSSFVRHVGEIVKHIFKGRKMFLLDCLSI